MEIHITTSTASKEVIYNLKQSFSRFGVPLVITSDNDSSNGSAFSSAEIKAFFTEYNIQMEKSIPYWPQMSGEVERQNSTILKRLIISQQLKQNWREDLFTFLLQHHNTPHSTTSKTPYELMFGRTGRNKLPMLKCFDVSQNEEIKDLDRIKKQKGKEYAGKSSNENKSRGARTSEICAGDKVLVKTLRNRISYPRILILRNIR